MFMNRELIEQYVAGGAKLRRAVTGLTQEELRARPGPGAWSVLEVVVHLADSDAISIDRMKRILTEENPPLLYADETAYVERLLSLSGRTERPGRRAGAAPVRHRGEDRHLRLRRQRRGAEQRRGPQGVSGAWQEVTGFQGGPSSPARHAGQQPPGRGHP